MKTFILFTAALLLLSASFYSDDELQGWEGIQVSEEFPQYWAYQGKPVLLLGGSDEDNLFQMEGVKEQLNHLAACGGNYVRNTMSCRDSGDVWPFYQDPGSGKYNLDRWNDAFWERFSNFLHLTYERKIFVQIEVWATFDFYREVWDENPYNPANNRNYSAERVKLPEQIPTHPLQCDNPFFWSVPSCDNNTRLLQYQQRFVDKMLSYSLEYDHVLYCMDNETSVTSEWGRFWADYIRKVARESGAEVNVTEMWDPWDLNHVTHRESFDHPEIYTFVDISQNNHNKGQRHWDNGLYQIERLKRNGDLRPVNNVKIYGSDEGRYGGNTDDAIQKFIQNIIFGSASARFHRPESGIGLNEQAQAVIRSVRKTCDRMDFFKAEPANNLLLDRDQGEAFCRAIPGEEYLVYFPGSGSVDLMTGSKISSLSVTEVNILSGEESSYKIKPSTTRLQLESKDKHHFFLIKGSE